VINSYNNRRGIKSFFNKKAEEDKKYRDNPQVQQALNEIALVSEIQNKIAYANSFVVRTGKLFLRYMTEDELEIEELGRKEMQKVLQSWEEQCQQLEREMRRKKEKEKEEKEKEKEKQEVAA
jgi:predicted S18 family serine protease